MIQKMTQIEEMVASGKIARAFQMGFHPSGTLIEYDEHSRPIINCFAHAICNFPKEIIKNISRYKICEFLNLQDCISTLTSDTLERAFLARLESFSLEAHPCNPDDPVDEKSWKVVMYIKKRGDFHFLKQENKTYRGAPVWSHKLGSTNSSYTCLPPESYMLDHMGHMIPVKPTSKPATFMLYERCGFYMITNPNAKETTPELIKKIETQLDY